MKIHLIIFVLLLECFNQFSLHNFIIFRLTPLVRCMRMWTNTSYRQGFGGLILQGWSRGGCVNREVTMSARVVAYISLEWKI